MSSPPSSNQSTGMIDNQRKDGVSYHWGSQLFYLDFTWSFKHQSTGDVGTHLNTDKDLELKTGPREKNWSNNPAPPFVTGSKNYK